MVRFLRRLAVALLVAGWAHVPLAAQGSPYVALDDPWLPLFEHLVARGSVADPSPFLRPFRRSDAVRVLQAAHGDSASVRVLLGQWDRPDSLWEIAGRLGSESFTHARRDPLHPEGIGGTRIYGDLRLGATIGGLVLVSRPAIDMRSDLDPDWTGQRGKPSLTCCRWRFPEAYFSWQPRGPFRFYLGQLSRNWGSVGLPGIALSNVGYPRSEVTFEVSTERLQLLSTVSQLHDTRTGTGTVIHRYHIATSLGVRLGGRATVRLWQSALAQGNDRELEGPFRNPLILLPLANQIGQGDEGNNVMLGVQGEYRLGQAIRLQSEFVLDDYIRHSRDSFPDRYALTLSATGPAPAGSAFRFLYTRASSLAFRTANPDEDFVDRGVGLGRGFADNDQLSASLTRPLGTRLLGGLELAALRQGEGRINAPIPDQRPIPGIFIGTVERTIRAAVHLDGALGPLTLQSEAGVNHTSNTGHIAGRTTNAFSGRILLLFHTSSRGTLR